MAQVEKSVVVSASYDLVSAVMMEFGRDLVTPEAGRFVIRFGSRIVHRDVVTTAEAPFRDTRPVRFTTIPFQIADRTHPRAFPRLDAELEALARPDGATDVTVVGWYDPPSRSLGDAIDAIGFHRLARPAIERHFDAVLARVQLAVRARLEEIRTRPAVIGGQG